MLMKDRLTEALLGTDGHGVCILNGGLISQNYVVADGPRERGNRLVTHLQYGQVRIKKVRDSKAFGVRKRKQQLSAS